MSFFNELRRRNVIRVAVAYAAVAWLLIQVAETVFPLFDYSDTPARVVVVVLAIGFIPAMVLTWVFEWTPQGLKRDIDVDHSRPSHPAAARKLDCAIIVLLTLAVGYFAVDKFVLEPSREAVLQDQQAEQLASVAEQARWVGRREALIESYGEKSIAVLPFVNMSVDADQAYFSDGISEELLNLLARIPGLRVISRTSSFVYKNRDVNLAQIARELDVVHILEGSVRKSGNHVRITAQLIDARSDSHLWSETWDRTLDDIFEIQDEIAAAVVEQLKLRLLRPSHFAGDPNPQAYTMLLQARHLARLGTTEGYAQSIGLYQQALGIRPDYAAAWVGLAISYSNQTSKGLRPLEEGHALAREALQQALAIDPDYAPAHSQLGWLAMLHDNNLPLAAQLLEQALALAPTNLGIIGNAATLLFTLDRLRESIQLDEYVNTHDPVNPTGFANLGKSYLAAGRWDEAIRAYQTALRLSPGRIGVNYSIGTARLLNGEAAAALDAMQQEEFELLRLIGLAMVYHALGRNSDADATLDTLISQYPQDAAYNIAYVLAYRGEADRAFEWLQRAVSQGDPGLADINSEPLFQALHADPRWLPFLESIGRSPSQLAAIPFAVTRPGNQARALPPTAVPLGRRHKKAGADYGFFIAALLHPVRIPWR